MVRAGQSRVRAESGLRWDVNSWAEWSECGIVTRLLLTSDRLLVLKHPLLLSIIKIIESGLEELSKQAANAVRSDGRKSDCFLALPLGSCSYSTWHHLFHSYICNFSLILTFALIHLLSSLTHACLLVVPFFSKFFTYETPTHSYIYNILNHLHLKTSISFTYVKKLSTYIWKRHPYLHL